MIGENIEAVQANIRQSCEKAGRTADDVTLIAVSKTKPADMVREAYACGCRHFGENKVKELVSKYEELPKDIKWHMIGHLQTNKVKYLVDKVFLIHSVDSYRLAQEISKEAVKKQVEVSILMEVNVAGEDSKFGVSCEQAPELAAQIALLPAIHLEGLMTIAPVAENAEDNRSYFAKLKHLSVDIIRKNIDNINMNVLSMGMTGDYQTAVEEGAVYVRVGTGIFGERQYC